MWDTEAQRWTVDYTDPSFPRVRPDPYGSMTLEQARMTAVSVLIVHIDTLYKEVKKLLELEE